MKRYNLSEIMRTAHRTYKYVGKKQGKTFSQVLKSTWRLAKLDVDRQEAEARRKEEIAKRAAEYEAECREREAKEAKKVSRVEADTEGYGYGRGDHYSAWSGWGNYCGD